MSDQNGNGMVWDLTSFFPEFGGAEMQAFKEQIRQDIKVLQDRAAAADELNGSNLAEWEELILLAEDFGRRLGHIWSYIGCLSSADAGNEDYARELGELAQMGAEFSKFEVDLQRAFKNVTDDVFTEFLAREKLADGEHQIKRTREEASKTMSPAEEKLSADLGVDGIHAWGRLYDTISGKLEFEMKWPDGKTEMLPISRWRSLMSDADRNIGKAAFEGGNQSWAKIEDTCAAALNAISGTRLTLYKHRGVEHYLERALFQSSISRETLDAMYTAIRDNNSTPQEIFIAKGNAMGRDGIWWFEREAPLPVEGGELYSWEAGSELCGKAFARAYPALAEYYEMFLEKRWCESEVRAGKRPGAFCTGSEHTREQRVYMTFNGTLGDVTTLAHEVGHAWHGWLLKDRRPLAQQYPMTLAETASIFAEQILSEGLLSNPEISDAEKLLLLDGQMSDAAVNLLDITVRFEFEKKFHDERQKGEVSVSRIKELMVETQREIWGGALLDDGTDPLFWASKLHFYITGVTFYNFPYTFGFLMAKALAVMFRDGGADFLPRYEDFLRLTGSDNAEGVAKTALGVDITDPAFWAKSIKGLEAPLVQYKELLAGWKTQAAGG